MNLTVDIEVVVIVIIDNVLMAADLFTEVANVVIVIGVVIEIVVIVTGNLVFVIGVRWCCY